MATDEAPKPKPIEVDIDFQPWPHKGKHSDEHTCEMAVELLDTIEEWIKEDGSDENVLDEPLVQTCGSCIVVAMRKKDGTTLIIEGVIKRGAVVGLKVPKL